MWEDWEPSCVVTVLHPALMEMLRAQIDYLLAAFSTVAGRELRAPGVRGFKDVVWQGFVDLAAIQMPICGLIKDQNKFLDTDIRGENLIHRVGSASGSEASLTTRLLLRYDSFEEDDVSDAELFRESRASMLVCRILQDYRTLYPHANDGLSIAVYQNDDIQPIIAAIDKYLKAVCENRDSESRRYAIAVTVFTESSDDSSVARWIGQWKERWEAAETQASLAHYRQTHLSISHRIVAPEQYYRQFVQLIESGLDVDIAFLTNFVRAGSEGNDFQAVDAYDVRTRTLKFPILEKSFCASSAPGRRLRRARVLSNRQFLLTTGHAEIMARLKSPATPQNTSHVVLGYGDYTPWQGVVDALHHRAEWVVAIDPNIDERLIGERGRDSEKTREIIGFGSGVGAHGEANYTISTEHFQLSDVLFKLIAAIEELYSGWDTEIYQQIAQSVLAEAQRLSGLSLVRATGVGQYIRDFMAYALTRKLLRCDEQVLCDQLVSLDAYQHWFESADSGMRPDLLWVVARIDSDGRVQLDLRLIECKLAQMSEAHLDKAREQLENGLRHLPAMFMPRVDHESGEDERPDQRYWWLQLHRLIASKAEIAKRDEQRVLTALERLADGDYDVEWRACAITFWTDQESSEITQAHAWPCDIEGNEFSIIGLSAGTELVRSLCSQECRAELPWEGGSVPFHASAHRTLDEDDDSGNDEGDDTPPEDRPPITPNAGGGARVLPEDREPQNTIAPTPTAPPDRILLGTTSQGSRKVYWEFGHKDLSNRHLLIFGSSGMGKTYTIQCLLCELGRCGQNSLIVDYTNGFMDNQLESEFKAQLSPVQHIVRRKPLAINPFRRQIEIIGDEAFPEVASITAQRVSGVFSEVYSFGDQQKSALYQAIKNGLEQTGDAGISLEDLIPRLDELTEDKGTQGQSAGSVISKLRPFLDQNPFGTEEPDSWERLFNDSIHRCHVIQLAGFMKDAGQLVTEFSLIDLYWFYRGVGTQSKPRVIVLDEVQNLDHREESPLAQLLREGRKFGFSLILATQIMSNLDRDERDRLFLAGHKLFFRPADTEMRSYAEIAAVSTGDKVDVWQKRLAGLKKGECYSLGPSLNEATGTLEVKAFKIQISSLGDRSINA
jgi:DNA phosphorothioation-dependent restriction protein DptH